MICSTRRAAMGTRFTGLAAVPAWPALPSRSASDLPEARGASRPAPRALRPIIAGIDVVLAQPAVDLDARLAEVIRDPRQVAAVVGEDRLELLATRGVGLVV